jgi:hypothetical protein
VIEQCAGAWTARQYVIGPGATDCPTDAPMIPSAASVTIAVRTRVGTMAAKLARAIVVSGERLRVDRAWRGDQDGGSRTGLPRSIEHGGSLLSRGWSAQVRRPGRRTPTGCRSRVPATDGPCGPQHPPKGDRRDS